ncbi:MAG: DEAD/DEAH box helicase, partial [Candidatus Competibacteraceae bacterium]|nr:DEAD/DEAH box helicase [Candidatus Competibacteraceae bacterium]
MAEAVVAALEEGDTLVVEAGTGTGKTYAYLIPALLSGARVIISTGTRHLQDQLYHQDLPVVRQALNVPVRTALLKGRGNYLCRYRLQATEQAGRLSSREQVAEL